MLKVSTQYELGLKSTNVEENSEALLDMASSVIDKMDWDSLIKDANECDGGSINDASNFQRSIMEKLIESYIDDEDICEITYFLNEGEEVYLIDRIVERAKQIGSSLLTRIAKKISDVDLLNMGSEGLSDKFENYLREYGYDVITIEYLLDNSEIESVYSDIIKDREEVDKRKNYGY